MKNDLLSCSRPSGWLVRLRCLHTFFILCSLFAAVTLPGHAEGADPTVLAWGDNTYGQCTVPVDLTNATAIAGGAAHSLALKSDGTVTAWGQNTSHQTNVPANLASVIAIAAGLNHNLALQADGTVVAWGLGSSGQTNVPAGLAGVVAIAAGQAHSLALKGDGTVVAWGNNSFGQRNVPSGLTNVIAIAASYLHSLALKSDGRVVAWGNQTNVPPDLTNVVAIAGGQAHALALKQDGTVAAWGANGSGQATVPPTLSNVVAIAAGANHSLAMKADGTIVIWGANGSGQSSGPPFLTNVIAVAGGGVHSLAIAHSVPPYFVLHPVSQSVLVGTNMLFTALAQGSAPLSYRWQLNGVDLPNATNTSLVLSSVEPSASGSYSCIVANNYGASTSQIAVLTVTPFIVTIQPQSQTVLMLTNVAFNFVANALAPATFQWKRNGTNLADNTHFSGAQRSMLVVSNAQPQDTGLYRAEAQNAYGTVLSSNATLVVVPLAAWGENANGQRVIPMDLTNVVAVAAGGFHTLALRDNGTVTAWGLNTDSQTNVPSGLSNVVAIAAGVYHSLALRGDGRVFAWGFNANGQTNVPSNLSNVVAISAYGYHNLALKSDGTVVSWGDRSTIPPGLTNVLSVAAGFSHDLALVTGGTVRGWGSAPQATPPASASNVVAIAAGYVHSMAVRADGTVVAWGQNPSGQTNVPPGLSNVVRIAAGFGHSLARKADGTVVAWGLNASGQTNVPFGLSDVSAIAAGFYHSVALCGRTGGSSPIALADAVNSPDLPWRTRGDAPWFNQSVVAHDGLRAAQSGSIKDGEQSWMETTVNGPLILTFWWKVSSEEDFDYLTFLVNGKPRAGISGEVDWRQESFLIPPGEQTLRWAYSKDAECCTEGQDAGWLDQITLSPVPLETPPIIWDQASPQIASPGMNVGFGVSVFSFAPLSYQWQFNGTDLPGATNPVLSLVNVQATDSGRYRVLVRNPYGAVVSSNVTLTVAEVMLWWYTSSGQTNMPLDLTNVVAISGGGYHSLVLQDNGVVVELGYNGARVTNAPAGLTNVVAISGGGIHNLALRADATVAGWGDNGFGQASIPAGLSNVVAIAGGGFHSLALKADGGMAAWGDNQDRQTDVPSGLTDVVAVAAGFYHSLALRADGRVFAWGRNYLYDSDSEIYTYSGQTNVPAGLSNVVAIAAGTAHSLALRADGTVVAWGSNYDEDGDYAGQSNVPPGLSNVVAIDAKGYHSLALRSDGTVVDWGYSGSTDGLTHVVAIAAGGFHNLALIGNGSPLASRAVMNQFGIAGGTVYLQPRVTGDRPLSYQWQLNGVDIPSATNALMVLTNLQPMQAGIYSVEFRYAFGSFRVGATRVSVFPCQITGQPQPQTFVPGGSLLLTVTAQSLLPLSYQWRFNGADIPGATEPALRLDNLPPEAAGGYSVVMSNAYGLVTSAEAVLSLVDVAAWGEHGYDQAAVPASLTNIVGLAAGFFHNLALRADGTVVGWGYNWLGQIAVPASVTNVVAVAAGSYHSVALQRDGTVAAWGDKSYGQTTLPAGGVANAVAIACGGIHSLALLADGTVVAWGYNGLGQTTVPAGLSNVVAIAAGNSHSLALRADGSVVAWGGNGYGQSTVPTGLTNVVALAAGGEHTMALRGDGSVAAWGYNGSGQTNVPLNLTNVVAIAAGYSHSLALRADGTVVTWGYNFENETDVPAGLTNVIAIAAAGFHSTALVGDGSPLLTVQPFDQDVPGGGAVILNAGVVGNQPIAYQWQLNGTNVPGATNASLHLPSVQLASMGIYSLVVSNAQGAVTSRLASLRVEIPPSFTQLTSRETVQAGATITFDITATGTAPLFYHWRKNGVNIPGATNAILTITNVQLSDGGSYSVVVANSAGVTVSDPTLLLVDVSSQAPPEDSFINRRPITGTNGFASGTNTFATREPGEPSHASKFGSNSVWYRWTAPANGIATLRTVGSTFDTLLGIYTGTNVGMLTPVASDEDRGGFLTSQARFNAQSGVEYQIAVDGFAAQQGTFVLSWDLELTSDSLPVILSPPASQTVPLGSPATFAVAATGPGLTYQWFFDLKPIAGAKGAVLSLPNVQAANVGLYFVAITNSAGRGVETLPVSLEIGSVAGVQSVGKLEDLLTPGGFGFAPLTGPHGKGTSSAGSAGGELLVGVGTINSQILNNTSPTNSGVPLPQSCSGIGGSARALILTPTNSATLVIDTTGSSINTLLAVYTASGFTFTSIACDNSGSADGPSRVRFEALAGTRYLVAADGMNNAQGTIALNWAMGRAPVVQSTATNQVLKRGNPLTLNVTVSNAIPPARCQWLLNNHAIAGATNTTLLLANVQTANAGVYSVLVSNAIQSVLQGVAVVTLEPEATLWTASNFEHDGDAWTFTGEASSWIYQVTGGRFGGYLSALGQSAGGNWNWNAPGKFLGNQALAYGGWLQFDLKRSGTSPSPKFPQVNLSGGGLTLYFKTTAQPGTDWTTYSIRLQEGAGWLRGDGTPAFSFDLQRALGSLASIQISGQFSASQESAGLDAVQFLVPCTDDPPPLSLHWQSDPAAWVLEWPANALCFQLEMADNLRTLSWTTNLPVLESITANGVKRMTISRTGTAQFFRLRKE